MKKNIFIIILILIISVLTFYFYKSTLNKNQTASNLTPPNIILISIDTLRADHMSLYGYKFNTTPKLDQFSQKAIVYDFAFCPIPKTSASFASIMTGLHPFIHRTKPIRSKLGANHIPLAEALKFKDYSTHAVVDNGNLSPKYQFNQGFDQYMMAWDKIKSKTESTKYITDKGIEFLNNTPGKPFFLWLHYIEPHTPYIPPKKFITPFTEKGRNINEIKQKIVAGGSPTRKQLKENSDENHFISLYDGAIKYVDSEIGRILDVFEEKQLDKNTILIITSDHGEELGEYNLFFDHGPLTFNASIRVPLMIYFPKKKSSRVQKIVNIMDIYPTVLSQVGLTPHRQLQGINLLQELPDRNFYIFGQRSHAIVTSDGFLYTKIEKKLAKQLGIKTNYLFNFLSDPLGKSNIISRNGSLSKKLETKYQKYFSKHTYPGKTKKDKNINLSKKEIKSLKTLGYIE